MAGEFQTLLPFKWKGRQLPVSKIHISLAHDLVEHKYWGVDGGRVEDTGVCPVRINAIIPISNHIFPGPQETWKAGTLFPTELRAFIVDFGKRTTDILQHPEFGEMKCKAERLDFELSGDRQGATEVNASWVETLDDEIIAAARLSGVSDLQGAADDLQANYASLKALAPTLPEFKEDIASLGRKLSAIADSVTVLSYRQAGVVNNILYQASRIELSVRRAKNALVWPAIQNLQIIVASAHEMRKKFLTTNGIGLYTVQEDTTLAGVVVALPKSTSVADVIKLNPNFMRSPVVQRGSVIRYPIAA